MYQIDFHTPLAVHFIGIGGISMSGLAEILLEEGFHISGSDAKESALTDALEKKGARIYYGQRASNISDSTDVVVYTAAIHPDNSALHKRRIYVFGFMIVRLNLKQIGDRQRQFCRTEVVLGFVAETFRTRQIWTLFVP